MRLTIKKFWDYALFTLFLGILLYVLFHTEYYIVEKSVLKKRVFLEAAVFLIGAVFLLLREKITRLLQKRAYLLSVLATVLTPLFTYAFTVYITNHIPRNFDPKNYLNNNATPPEAVVYNLMIIGLLLLILLVITNSMRISCTICIFTGILFCTANYFVVTFRSIPILASDFFSIGEAASVAGNFTYTPDFSCLLSIQIGLMFVFGFRCLGRTRLAAPKKRVILAVVTAVFLGVFLRGFVFSDYFAKRKIRVSMFKPLVWYNRNGTFLTLLLSWQAIRIDEPEGYDPEAVEELAASYPSDSASDGDALPNIIVIVDEAFSDLAAIGEINASSDYMPFIHSLQESGRCTHGYSYASVLGGGTANTEFEVLTGNSILLLPQNCIAFSAYLKKEMASLASTSKLLGYQGMYAVHPFERNNYNRPTAYSLLGFDTFLSKESFPKKVQKLRSYVSNLAVNDMIVQKYEEAKASSDAPFFLYTMTMQNHSYYTKSYKNLPIEITLPGDFPEAEQYLNLVKHSDEALKELTDYFEAQDDPTVILFVGDHQPEMKAGFLKEVTDGAYKSWSEEDSMKQYAVPFILWSNYDLPAKEYKATSMNYLWTILAETCGLPLTGYQKYLADLSREIPVITARGYWGSDGVFYGNEDTSSPYYDKLLEYECLVYNNMIDTGHRPEQFYQLQP